MIPTASHFLTRLARVSRAMTTAGVLSLMTASAAPELTWKQLPTLPDAEGFASAFAGVSGGALLVGGGANFPAGRPWEGGKKVWYDDVFALEQGSGSWRHAGKLPRPVAYGVSVTAPSGTICAGGGDAAGHFKTVFKLTWDHAGLHAAALPDLPATSAFGSGALAGNYFYLIGGIEKPDATTAQDTFWRLDVSVPGKHWEQLPPCPGGGRMLAQAGSVGGTFYVCGGVALTAGPDGKPVRTYLRDAYAYEPKTGWRRLADMPHGVAAAASPMPASERGELLVISGDDGSRAHLVGPNHPGFLQEVLVYDSAQDCWVKAGPDAPISRATTPTAPWGGGCVIASGERRPGYRSPEVWLIKIAP